MVHSNYKLVRMCCFGILNIHQLRNRKLLLLLDRYYRNIGTVDKIGLRLLVYHRSHVHMTDIFHQYNLHDMYNELCIHLQRFHIQWQSLREKKLKKINFNFKNKNSFCRKLTCCYRLAMGMHKSYNHWVSHMWHCRDNRQYIVHNGLQLLNVYNSVC